MKEFYSYAMLYIYMFLESKLPDWY